jgi:predicted Rdx family selenoprotein
MFDVIVDGKVVFSKSKAGRFPEPGEITRQIKA